MPRIDEMDKAVADNELEALLQSQGKALLRAMAGVKSKTDFMGQFLSNILGNQDLKTRALRFIDTLPELSSDAALLEHLRAYFQDGEMPLPGLSGWALKQKAGDKLLAGAVRKAFNLIASRFVAGANLEDALALGEKQRLANLGISLDLLGEASLSDQSASRYAHELTRCLQEAGQATKRWPVNPQLDIQASKPIPRLNFSLKLSSLLPRIAPQDIRNQTQILAEKVRPILRVAQSNNLSITFDMEGFDTKDLILNVFKTLMSEPEFADWTGVGIAIQTYLTSAREDLTQLLAWVKKRGAPIHIRLVRGAYWDEEVIKSLQHGWEIPVWQGQGLTDKMYETCLKALFKTSPLVTPVVASHNLRTVSLAMTLAQRYQVAKDGFEFQSIWGMGGRMPVALANLGYRMRLYAPFGELLPGMAYLVRRLLENSSSQQALASFQSTMPDESELAPRSRKQSISYRLPAATFANTATLRFVNPEDRSAFSSALARVKSRLGRNYPLIINGRQIESDALIESTNPALLTEVVGRVSRADHQHADQAVAAARAAYPAWQGLGFAKRAEILNKTADALTAKRADFAAWEVYEAGKTWREADADVTEAIDFLRYYARLGASYENGLIQDAPGQTSRTLYRGRGVGLVLAPWNFPLAILVGMTAATLVTGNTCVLKPSSLTPIVAYQFVRLMHDLGLPAGVLNFLPGKGSSIGERLVNNPNVNVIAFTGSHRVGLGILQLAAEAGGRQSMLKRVIAEMGGKNAIIVDEGADLEEAVASIIQSAFGYQGQKCSACSRVIAVGGIHDRLAQMLAEATDSLRTGMPADPGSEFGPVIDQESKDRIEKLISAASKSATLHYRGQPKELGHYVPPAIFTNVQPNSELAQEEIFGPVLAILKAQDFNQALVIANSTKYALTGGVYSRNPAHLEQATHEFMVGNLYLNRGITGALVGRQPFGGFKMSGTGPKAGGPDYLLPFLEPHCVVENCMRKGVAPLD